MGEKKATHIGDTLTYFSWPWLLGVIFSLTFIFSLVAASAPASALTTVPAKINFQGRLANSTGTALANNTYNMKVRLYTVGSGGSSAWNEDRLVSAGNGVQVTNGLFSIRLGDVTPIPASLFASGNLYLEVELPTPATATSTSPSWTEGAMTPRNILATSAYSFNSETLDGLDSAVFAQIGANNTLTGNNLFKPTTDSPNAFAIQNSTGTSLLRADSTNADIIVGSSTTDADAIFLAVDSYNGGTDPAGGFNGAMYYNTSLDKLRCFEAGAWKDCISAGGTVPTAFVLTNVPGAWGATAARATNLIVISPFHIPAPITVNQIRIRLTTAFGIGATGDAGIYNSAGNLVLNGGSGSVSAALGLKTLTPVQSVGFRTLQPGQYYAAITWNNATGVVAGAALGANAVARSGTIAGGGTVLPASITPSSISDTGFLYAMSISQ